MNRWLARIVVCIILGVATTVGVALAAAQWATGRRYSPHGFTPGEMMILKEMFGASDGSLGWWFANFVKGPAAEWRFYSPHHSGPAYMTGQFGWPRAALKYQRRGEWNGVEGEWTEEEFDWLMADVSADAAWKAHIAGRWNVAGLSRPMPYAIEPFGFVVDATLHAAAWFGMLAVFPALRRTRRRRRGLCPLCGYNLRGELHNGCPECGWRKEGGAS